MDDGGHILILLVDPEGGPFTCIGRIHEMCSRRPGVADQLNIIVVTLGWATARKGGFGILVVIRIVRQCPICDLKVSS